MLSGIRVLDCSSLIPGPFCAMMLADLGADVTKVESPKGDGLRSFGTINGVSPYFVVINRGKKIVVLNLKTKEGKGKLHQLVKGTDVIIIGTRPMKAADLGLAYSQIRKMNKRIVYCSITGYGMRGRKSKLAGHDINYLAHSGMLPALSGNSVSVPGVQHADLAAGTLACSVILAALFSRQKTGKGVCLDLSMADATSYFFGMYLSHDSLAGMDRFLAGACPCYNVYKTKDHKWVALGAVEEKFWKAWCGASKMISLEKKQWSMEKDVIEKVRDVFMNKTAKEWVMLGNLHDFCCEEVLDAKSAVSLGMEQKKWEEVQRIPVPSLGFGVFGIPVSQPSWKKKPTFLNSGIEREGK